MDSPTPYADVNVLLYVLLAKVQAILGVQFVGLYVYGSLSLGDFDPASSDIDFLVVTEGEIEHEAFELLREMHATIAASELVYARRVEGSYIPRQALRRYDPDNARHPTIGSDWPFQVGFHKENWIIERFILRQQGVTVYGPAPATFIDPIEREEIHAAVCKHLKDFWRLQLDQAAWLRPRHYQAFAVLTLCRALYTLRCGVVGSKPQAAAWAQEAYPRWKPIIERSLLWRRHHIDDDLTETLAFLREALMVAEELCESDERNI